MRRAALALAAMALVLPGCATIPEARRTGRIIAIDGGTLEVDGARVPLWGIKVADPTTTAGWQAKLFLSTAVSEGPVSCALKLPEPALWQCLTVHGFDLGSLLVQTGLAYAAGPYYQFEESRARIAERGLWRLNEGKGR